MNLNLDKYFLNNSSLSQETYLRGMQKGLENISKHLNYENIYSGKSIQELKEIAQEFDIKEKPESLNGILDKQLMYVLENSLNVNSPKSMAHLHCPVMLPSLIAELFISALNQSMDSWDQSPIATYIEQNTIEWLSSLIYSQQNMADGIFTSGGTQSNLMGLLLARDSYCKNILNHDVSKNGLPAQSSKFKVLCTQKTHFSVHKSLSLLGLGMNSIEIIDTGEDLCIDTNDLTLKIQKLIDDELIPLCIVTTAGDTDFGCIDDIEQIALIANKNNVWLHVDAAVGGALLLSDKHKSRLDGLAMADSITVDFHKLFFQPVSCGAFFCKDKSFLNLINYHADYLNPGEDGFDGLNLVDKSIQTTRRFDALKLSIALKCSGTKLFSLWIDHIIETTTKTIDLISSDASLELAFKGVQHLNNSLNTVVFRYSNTGVSIETLNVVNNKIHKTMLMGREFAIAQTKINKNTYLKITFVNPMITLELVKKCLEEITSYGSLFIEKEFKGAV